MTFGPLDHPNRRESKTFAGEALPPPPSPPAAPILHSAGRFRECRSQFAARVKQLLEHVRTENANSSARVCDKLAKELCLGSVVDGSAEEWG